MLPVDRGPESLQSEHLRLPYWYAMGNQLDLFSSGFGPYGLTRLAYESGGIYFVYDDDAMAGPKFENDIMMDYLPDYQSIRQYAEMLERHPLRAAIVNAARESSGANFTLAPQTQFGNDNLADQLTRAQQPVSLALSFINKAIVDLKLVEKHRNRETSKRWQAHYDLVMGRLLANRVRCNEYLWALASMKTNPKTLDGKNNAWRLVGDKEINYMRKEEAAAKNSEPEKKAGDGATNVKKQDSKATAVAKQDAEAALVYLNRVAKDHQGTPWGMMAEREIKTQLGFKWTGFFIPPPPRNPPQPTAAAKEAERRREEDRKAVPKKI
jgi:hypothetical protein